MGNTCTPVVDSCWCVAKPIQYCKVISLQLNKFKLDFKKGKKAFIKLKKKNLLSWRYSPKQRFNASDAEGTFAEHSVKHRFSYEITFSYLRVHLCILGGLFKQRQLRSTSRVFASSRFGLGVKEFAFFNKRLIKNQINTLCLILLIRIFKFSVNAQEMRQ